MAPLSASRGSLSHLSVTRRVTLALVLSVTLAVVAGSVGIWLAVQASDASRTTLNTLLPARSTADQLLADVIDQETGERGFVITSEPTFLQPYELGRRATPSLIATLHEQLAGHKVALALLAQVAARYETWLHVFAVSQVREVTGGDVAAAIAREKTARVKHSSTR